MSETTGETPTPKRGPGRPPKNPPPLEAIIEPAIATVEIGTDEIERLIRQAHEAGYREGWNACAQKHKPALFESAKRWALEHAGTFPGNAKDVVAAMNDGFDELEIEYGGEKLIASDRNLLIEIARQHVRRVASLKSAEPMNPAVRRANRTIVDEQEVVVS